MATVIAIGFLIGLISMLLALYHVKENKKRAGIFLVIAVIFYFIAAVAVNIDSKEDKILAKAFLNSQALKCTIDNNQTLIISIKDGWSIRGNEYLVKEKKVIYIRSCKNSDTN